MAGDRHHYHHHDDRYVAALSPIAPALGFQALPSLYWPLLALTLVCYVFLTQGVKVWLLRKASI